MEYYLNSKQEILYNKRIIVFFIILLTLLFNTSCCIINPKCEDCKPENINSFRVEYRCDSGKIPIIILKWKNPTSLISSIKETIQNEDGKSQIIDSKPIDTLNIQLIKKYKTLNDIINLSKKDTSYIDTLKEIKFGEKIDYKFVSISNNLSFIINRKSTNDTIINIPILKPTPQPPKFDVIGLKSEPLKAKLNWEIIKEDITGQELLPGYTIQIYRNEISDTLLNTVYGISKGELIDHMITNKKIYKYYVKIISSEGLDTISEFKPLFFNEENIIHGDTLLNILGKLYVIGDDEKQIIVVPGQISNYDSINQQFYLYDSVESASMKASFTFVEDSSNYNVNLQNDLIPEIDDNRFIKIDSNFKGFQLYISKDSLMKVRHDNFRWVAIKYFDKVIYIKPNDISKLKFSFIDTNIILQDTAIKLELFRSTLPEESKVLLELFSSGVTKNPWFKICFFLYKTFSKNSNLPNFGNENFYLAKHKDSIIMEKIINLNLTQNLLDIIKSFQLPYTSEFNDSLTNAIISNSKEVYWKLNNDKIDQSFLGYFNNNIFFKSLVQKISNLPGGNWLIVKVNSIRNFVYKFISILYNYFSDYLFFVKNKLNKTNNLNFDFNCNSSIDSINNKLEYIKQNYKENPTESLKIFQRLQLNTIKDLINTQGIKILFNMLANLTPPYYQEFGYETVRFENISNSTLSSKDTIRIKEYLQKIAFPLLNHNKNLKITVEGYGCPLKRADSCDKNKQGTNKDIIKKRRDNTIDLIDSLDSAHIYRKIIVKDGYYNVMDTTKYTEKEITKNSNDPIINEKKYRDQRVSIIKLIYKKK